jgi:hypothetical protein
VLGGLIMAKYRKKPVAIDAIQWTKTTNLYELMDFLEDINEECRLVYELKEGRMICFVTTLEGNMMVSDGDYIIKGVKNEIYPCKEDVFLATYEKVED